MAILIDPPFWPAHGRLWSHLISDVSFTELHAFTRRLGIPERGFEGDHYDVPQERYATVVAGGALPVTGRELLSRLQAAGLRRPKRRGERVLSSLVRDVDGVRIDTLASRLPPLAPVSALLLLAARAGRVLAVPAPDGLDLPRRVVAVGGRPWPALAVRFAAELFGPDGGTGPDGAVPAQLGYLRFVGPGRSATDPTAVRIELVARLRPVRHDPDPAADARWVHPSALIRGRPALAGLVRLVVADRP
jgi:hypothetical protein